MDDVAAVEDVAENEACGAATKWAGHGEHSPLGRLEPPENLEVTWALWSNLMPVWVLRSYVLSRAIWCQFRSHVLSRTIKGQYLGQVKAGHRTSLKQSDASMNIKVMSSPEQSDASLGHMASPEQSKASI